MQQEDMVRWGTLAFLVVEGLGIVLNTATLSRQPGIRMPVEAPFLSTPQHRALYFPAPDLEHAALLDTVTSLVSNSTTVST